MAQPRKPRGISATQEGLEKLQQAKAAGRDENGKPLTYERIAQKAGVDAKTVQRFFGGKGVDRDSAIAIVQALGLDITEIVDPKDWNPAERTSDTINWREVCGNVLAQQQEQQRLRRQATERGFELNVYVPLGLVERKQQQRRRGDVPLDQVYQLTEEVITKEYDNNQFLTQVINSGKSKRIAIIGEPGAGKTTLQEKIAVWIQEKNKGLPICLSLGGLQGKSLIDYLQQKWLKTALRFIEPDAVDVEARHIASLQKQFREGKVWLLLDGVDEMAATSAMEALATIKEQLTDGLVEARVVLTCRLNVWDANVNGILAGFETYKTLEFKPEQVEIFIQEWFTEAEESQRGEILLKKLQEPGKERIRELVRNPLRLSLLCQTAYLLPIDEPLPETKAALYQRFTRYFYEWKQEQHPTTRTQQRQLNQALGELAKAGINRKTRFRLGEDFACEIMGESLFDLACRLGWLNLVDRDTNTDEPVYAFFHPTFQEYFAACAIDDWHFFLNHVPENPMQGTYRIFESQWKEVILLWLGREDVEKENKEEFIRALVKFDDKCYNLYGYQAFLLAAAGIAEFRDCQIADYIINWIIQLSCGYYINCGNSRILFSHGYSWQPLKEEDVKLFIFWDTIQKAARTAVIETDKARVINILKYQVDLCLLSMEISNIINELGELPFHSLNYLIMEAKLFCFIIELIGLICAAIEDCLVIMKIDIECKSLEAIGTYLSKRMTQIIYGKIDLLMNIDGETPENNNRLIQLLNFNRNELISIQVARKLKNTDILLEIAKSSVNYTNQFNAIYSLYEINPLNQMIVEQLITQTVRKNKQNRKNELFQFYLVFLLSLINQKTNKKSLNTFIRSNVFKKIATKDIAIGSVILSIGIKSKLINPSDILVDSKKRISYPFNKKYFKDFQNFHNIFTRINNKLWHCTQNMSYPDFYQAWHQATKHQGEYN